MNKDLTSSFMSKAAAADVLEKFESACSSLQKEKRIPVYSERPNVNLKVLEMLDKKRKDSNLNWYMRFAYLKSCFSK